MPRDQHFRFKKAKQLYNFAQYININKSLQYTKSNTIKMRQRNSDLFIKKKGQDRE